MAARLRTNMVTDRVTVVTVSMPPATSRKRSFAASPSMIGRKFAAASGIDWSTPAITKATDAASRLQTDGRNHMAVRISRVNLISLVR